MNTLEKLRMCVETNAEAAYYLEPADARKLLALVEAAKGGHPSYTGNEACECPLCAALRALEEPCD